MFWNLFNQSAAQATQDGNFVEFVLADDLNAFRKYDSKAKNVDILKDIASCQSMLHSWGRANQVSFYAAKESKNILSRSNPYGSPFRLLGIRFDCQLLWTDTVFGVGQNLPMEAQCYTKDEKIQQMRTTRITVPRSVVVFHRILDGSDLPCLPLFFGYA